MKRGRLILVCPCSNSAARLRSPFVFAVRVGRAKCDRASLRPCRAHFTIITLQGASSTSRCVVLPRMRLYSAEWPM